MIQIALAEAGMSFDEFETSISDTAREQLIVPLRQAPQPYVGGNVAPFPIDYFVSSPFYDSVKDVFALVFVLAYLYSISGILVVLI